MQSRAPEYSGSIELVPVKDPQTLATLAGERAPSATGSAAPPGSAAPVAALVPRLPGTPDLTKDGLYSFTGGDIELAVDPRSGSIARLSLDGKSALVPLEASSDNYGAEVEGSTLILKGASGGLTKRYRLDTARRSVEVTYTLENATKQAFHAGATDFHRVPSTGGLTFFPGAQKLLPGSTLKLNVWQPVVWFSHDQARDSATVEASVDSTEGWVANLNDGLLLVKVFGDTPKPTIVIASAYDPKTKQRPWVEIGGRSSFDLLPGASATSNVRLFLRKLPASIAAKPGNQELVGFVRGVIQ